MSYLRSQKVAGYLFLVPAFVLLLLASLVPIVGIFFYSLTKYNIIQTPVFIGLRNFATAFTDDTFLSSLGNTFYFAGLTVLLGTIVALLLAVMLNRALAGRAFFRSAIYLPQAMSYVAAALIWTWIYDPLYGLLNNLLRHVGLAPVNWLTDPAIAMPSIIVLSIWRTSGYYMVIFLAGLQGVPRQVYEAAEIDGARTVRSFFSITLPLLMPTVFLVVVMWSIGALQMFTQSFVMTWGGPAGATSTVVYQVYLNSFQYLKMGYGSAESVILFAAILVLTILNNRVFSRFSYTF